MKLSGPERDRFATSVKLYAFCALRSTALYRLGIGCSSRDVRAHCHMLAQTQVYLTLHIRLQGCVYHDIIRQLC